MYVPVGYCSRHCYHQTHCHPHTHQHIFAQVETEALLARARAATDRCHELKAQLDAAAAATAAEHERCVMVERELTATKADAEGMVRVIALLERQVADASTLVATARQTETDAAASVQSMTLERDAAAAREAQARRCVLRTLCVANTPPPHPLQRAGARAGAAAHRDF